MLLITPSSKTTQSLFLLVTMMDMGKKSCIQKFTWEESTRVPLTIRAPDLQNPTQRLIILFL